RFPLSVTLLLLFFGPTFACMLDSTIGAYEFNYYDIMDGPAYTLMDLAVYFLYAPFGYFLIYFHDMLRLSGYYTLVYAICWSLASTGFEYILLELNVFHYNHGYQLAYSFPIYLASVTFLLIYYRLMNYHSATEPS